MRVKHKISSISYSAISQGKDVKCVLFLGRQCVCWDPNFAKVTSRCCHDLKIFSSYHPEFSCQNFLTFAHHFIVFAIQYFETGQQVNFNAFNIMINYIHCCLLVYFGSPIYGCWFWCLTCNL